MCKYRYRQGFLLFSLRTGLKSFVFQEWSVEPAEYIDSVSGMCNEGSERNGTFLNF